MTNISSIANKLNINFDTVKRYLYYLVKTLIIAGIHPYFTSPAKEITKAPVYYFEDVGLRNYIKQYQPEKAFVVNLTLQETVHVENTQVHFIPYYELFTEELGLFS